MLCPRLLQSAQPFSLPLLMRQSGRVELLAPSLETCQVTLPGTGNKLLRPARCRRPEDAAGSGGGSGSAKGTRRERRPRSCLFQGLKVKEIIHRQGVVQKRI